MVKNVSNNLDVYQNEVLECKNNALVVAAAGSGKTTTIIHKVKSLIAGGIAPQEILMISFTNASVNDIKKKINDDVDVFTFHKLAISILQKCNITYTLANPYLLNFIIKEYLLTCNKKEQKTILKFLKIKTNYKKFCQSKEFSSFITFIETFINLWKTNSLTFNDISLNKFSFTEKKILIIIFNIYKIYNEEKQGTKAFDFDDLIIMATKYVNIASLNYKYIFIDEFQDTSMIRFNLIEAIYNNTNSKIIAVGDDYQSIYRFSGCDLNIFLNFSQKLNNVEEIKLLNTYRSGQELVDIASNFISKNPLQIKKDLKSFKHESNPVIFVPYQNKVTMFKKVLDYLLTFTNDIMILFRNNKDIYSYIDNDFSINDTSLIYKERKIPIYTVHKAKGLESDYTIILNCNDELLGFPNQIENNHLINKILPNKEIKYAEERRLFYVALTRCRLKTFIFYNKSMPSPFITELKKIVKVNLNKLNYFK